MDEREYLPKSEWGDGEWQREPDADYWAHVGYNCVALRSAVGGNWCGYVAVPPGHPFWGVVSDECFLGCRPGVLRRNDDGSDLSKMMRQWFERLGPDERMTWDCNHRIDYLISVHGGITFSGASDLDAGFQNHPAGSADDWYLGFDCCHCFDYAPRLKALTRSMIMPFEVDDGQLGPREWESYCTLGYVRAETNRLAEQIAGYGLQLYRLQEKSNEERREGRHRSGTAPQKGPEGK